jgi:hypothetical protein
LPSSGVGADDDVHLPGGHGRLDLLSALAFTMRESWAMRTGRPWKRAGGRCGEGWLASSVVGTTTATCEPLIAP